MQQAGRAGPCTHPRVASRAADDGRDACQQAGLCVAVPLPCSQLGCCASVQVHTQQPLEGVLLQQGGAGLLLPRGTDVGVNMGIEHGLTLTLHLRGAQVGVSVKWGGHMIGESADGCRRPYLQLG